MGSFVLRSSLANLAAAPQVVVLALWPALHESAKGP
eukprot:CAMPEP_0179147188 /NCGR_PEP_ID=MMETSP0796-20121207/71137_1 /TAXON_ID=73915 /ORGANISM="Pyrodinium bahamense, Strain pbaha01" /LENGTH=35 /DNA_ID= /DNA_START= /DNA_END= /DNA_ORIENTATION=